MKNLSFRNAHQFTLIFLLLGLQAPALALDPLDDNTLSDVVGQDGISFDLESSNAGISMQQLDIELDPGEAYQGDLSLQGVRIEGKADIGSANVANAPVRFLNRLDVGYDTSSMLGAAKLRYELQLDTPTRLTVDNFNLGGTNSFGSSALEADNARLVLVNSGIFDASATDAYLLGRIDDASLFYRQGAHPSPYLVMDDLNLFWEIPEGTLGIIDAPLDASHPLGSSQTYGILMSSGPVTGPLESRLINFALGFDLKYRNPAQDGDLNSATNSPAFWRDDPLTSPLFNFAWKGAFKDARLIWGTGGEWGSNSQYNQVARAGGLRLESRWNYVNSQDGLSADKQFRWRFGEADGDRWGIELSDWRNLPGAEYAHDWPLIAIDSIPADPASGVLCWGGADNGSTGGCATGGSQVQLSPGQIRSYGLNGTNHDSLAIMARDGNILAYSNQVRIMKGENEHRTMDWGLVYTLANVDGNIFVYPGGSPSDSSIGMVMDLLLMSQSFDATGVQSTSWNHATHWNEGMHVMIADTEACQAAGGPISCTGDEEGMGIGLIGSSLLIGANDTRFWVKPSTSSSDVYDSGIDLLSPQARINVRGTFGGGTLPAGESLVRGALVDINAEGLLNLRLSPPVSDCETSGGCYLGYSMAVRLYDISEGSLYAQDNTQLASGEGSYIKLAELNRPDMAYTLGDITGDFAITNGRADLRGPDEDGDDYEKLRLSNDIQFGATANARLINGTQNGVLPGGNAGQPFAINNVALGPDSMGKVVIPSGQWHFSTTLRPQTPLP